MEFLFSIVIFVVAVLTSLYVLTEAHKMSQLSRERLLALNAARSTLEMIKNTPLANIDTLTQQQLDANLPTTTDVNNAPVFLLDSGTIVVNWIDDGGTLNGNLDNNDQFARITIQVTWTNRTRVQIFEITTVKSRF